ncbi:MAG: NADH-quinone oxidoreductase subunit M [Dehalococcoidia bacterium]|nr:NADH-quinone oxidoreductase subunit M [Dehalococcoidia bacterium]
MLGGAFLMLLIPQRSPNLIRAVAVVCSLAVFVLSAYIFAFYDWQESGLQFEQRLPWLENVGFLGENGISLYFAVDGIAAPLFLLNGVVILAGTLISLKIKNRNKDFFILLFILASGVFGTFGAQDLFFFFFWYEVAVLPMYMLIGIWGSSTDFGTFLRTKEYGAMKLTMMLVAGSVLIFIGIFATFVEAGQGTFDLQVLASVEYDENFQKLIFPLFLIGFGTLAGMWPFHTWSPDGHVAAPTAVSMLHAGVLMKLGAFGILRVAIYLFPVGAAFWMPVLLVFGIVGAVYGAISAFGQRDLKYMIGYSSVSHMGYVLIGLATLNEIGVNGAVLQMFSHGVMTALFFAVVGSIYDEAHIRDMTRFGGLAKSLPLAAGFMAIAGLTSLGLPGFSGFVAEFHIFVGVFQDYEWAGVLAILAAAITAAYILRMLAMAFLGPFNERWSRLPDMSPPELMGATLLFGAILFMGLWPAPFIDRIASTIVGFPGISS